MMSEDLMLHFENYPWRGNIRELRNFIETAMNLVADEHVLSKEHLPVYYEELLDFSHGLDRTSNVDLSEGLNPYLESLERNLIEQEFVLQERNITKTAEKLKLSRQNLQYKLKKYELL